MRARASVAALLVGVALAAAPAPAAAAHSAHCEEDSPCFVWATMGNLSRGVKLKRHASAQHLGQWTPWGALIVDASEFCRLERRHRIDWRRTPHLKGDALARMRGCDARLFAQPA